MIQAGRMSTLDELLAAIFETRQHPLYAEFAGWVRGSRRFKVFATDYQAKIRSKLKQVRDDAGLKDLRTELETASLLLREERFALTYEKYAASRQRGPDFTITYKTHTLVNVEVRRLRAVEASDDPQIKLVGVLCDKVGQMPSGVLNVLWLAVEAGVTEAEFNRAAVTLRQLAESKNEAFFARRGFASAAEFLKQYQHLSAVVLHNATANAVWLNPLARHKLPPDLVTAFQRLTSN